MTATSHVVTKYGLSKRGERNAALMEGKMEKFLKVIANQYDAVLNPDGVVICGVADNSLCRKELVEFFNAKGRLNLEPRDLTYGDRIFASERLIKALERLINDVPDGLYDTKTWTPPLERVEEKHILVGSGATGILDALFWALCEPGEGVLISVPYYNAFDNDLTTRAEAKIIPVKSKLPEASLLGQEPIEAFSKDTVKSYEEACDQAEKEGIRVKVLLVCNPHNPTGAIYPRETIIDLAKLAAKKDLHLVMDEIYARSVFPTADVPNPTPFDSIFGIDTQKEAGLDPSRVHVVSGASKDYSINGFRLGLLITQHNQPLMHALTATSLFAQTASPAGQLWAALLNDEKYLDWYLDTNRSRLTKTYNYVTDFFKSHQIPYVPGNAGHFFLIDLRAFLRPENGTVVAQKDAEAALSAHFVKNGVFIAPGAQYHHPIPGYFRFTFSLEAKALRVGLERIEKALGLQSLVKDQKMVEY
ncbi:hypothetical protein CBS101457_006858 [Exobasidium rhododendri]|nr:hypothetical protein CBS101457_006858 [Exobasidium rhododendri]